MVFSIGLKKWLVSDFLSIGRFKGRITWVIKIRIPIFHYSIPLWVEKLVSSKIMVQERGIKSFPDKLQQRICFRKWSKITRITKNQLVFKNPTWNFLEKTSLYQVFLTRLRRIFEFLNNSRRQFRCNRGNLWFSLPR